MHGASPGSAVVTSSPGPAAVGSSPQTAVTLVQDPEPRPAVVVEQLLGLLDAVAGAVEVPELLEQRPLAMLVSALDYGLDTFSAGGFRVATAAVQVG
jgi:hypothetical protein